MMKDNPIKNDKVNIESTLSNEDEEIKNEEKTFEERTDPGKKPKGYINFLKIALICKNQFFVNLLQK